MNTILLISDAARQVKVEAHVLRYWEEELNLPIKRNELGHRYYTEEDVERFREIKNLKERGLQLKAIRIVLKDGKLDMLSPIQDKEMEDKNGKRQGKGTEREDAGQKGIAHQEDSRQQNTDKNKGNYTGNEIISAAEAGVLCGDESKEEKAQRLQWLLQQMFRETLQENNKELCREMKESVLKELDYQFRVQEEKEDERSAERLKRDEEHYKKIDELLRKKRRILKK